MIKSITIDFYGKEANYMLLEDIDDVMEYGEMLQGDVMTAAQRMIKTSLPPDRFDHLVTKDAAGAVINGAFVCASFRGTSPLLEAGYMADDKMRRLLGYAAQGEQIMINSVGAYCFVTPSTKILREEPYVSTVRQTHVINENTKYINLENDAELEQHTIDYLSEVDPNYSYITNLRDYGHEDLVNVFKEFKTKGGEIAYIYTTGGDIRQIHLYSNALHEAGIDTALFHFNSGMSDELKEAIDKVSEKLATITKEV